MLASFLCGETSYTSRAGFIFIWGVSLTHPIQALFLSGASFLCGEFLLHSPCWITLFLFSFLIWIVSLTHPVLASCLCGEFVLHIPSSGEFHLSIQCCFTFMWGVSLTHPVLVSFLCEEFILHIPFWLYFLSGMFLLHVPCWLVLFVFLIWEFLLLIPCWLELYLGSFTYTPSTRFIVLCRVSLTHPMVALFF